ncbi:TPA: hypothetical protein OOF48_003766, partial [Providencia rettgeri]|nr:hypothetical protein [Providencia rettgeri]
MITIESAVEFFKPWATKIFEEKVLPLVFYKGADAYNKRRNLYKLKNQMSEYLAKTRAQCSMINSLAFPNVLKKVNDIYVPLTLSMLDSREQKEYIVN